MKKYLIMLFLFLGISTTASAYDVPVDIMINDTFIKSESFIDNGTTYATIRHIAEAMGYGVSWNGNSQTVSISDGSSDIQLTINSKTAYVNGESRTVNAPRLINDRTYIPIRNTVELLGGNISWLSDYSAVKISKENLSVPVSSIDRSYTMDEIFWLGRIIEAESRGESMTGKIAVGNVILNRVRSSKYPNTIYNVIFDRKYGVQFQPISNGAIYNTPSKDSLSAAKLALSGTNVAGDCLYFLNPKIATNFWIINNRSFYKKIGNHDFYL